MEIQDNLFSLIPHEIFMTIFKLLQGDDLFALFLTCNKFYKVRSNIELWKYLVKQDFLTYYDEYAKDISGRNLKSQQAIETIAATKISLQFIDQARKNIHTYTDKYFEIPHLSDNDTNLISEFTRGAIANLNNIDYMQEKLLETLQINILSEPLVDILQIDPITLYTKFLEKSLTVPCINEFTQRAKRGLCGQPSISRTKYCKSCTIVCRNKKFPINPPLLPSVPKFVLSAPQLPPYIRPEAPQLPLSPPKLPPYKHINF